MKKIIILTLLIALFLFFGCTISVNPQDLAPSKRYSVLNDNNINSLDNNVDGLILDSLEVAKHNSSGNCWMVLNGNVYDLSEYVSHPGGNGYLSYCGKEATVGYDTKGGGRGRHSNYADLLLSNYLIGKLGQTVGINDINSSPNPVLPYQNGDDEFDDEIDDEFEDEFDDDD